MALINVVLNVSEILGSLMLLAPVLYAIATEYALPRPLHLPRQGSDNKPSAAAKLPKAA